jgi:hypothetical protein
LGRESRVKSPCCYEQPAALSPGVAATSDRCIGFAVMVGHDWDRPLATTVMRSQMQVPAGHRSNSAYAVRPTNVVLISRATTVPS